MADSFEQFISHFVSHFSDNETAIMRIFFNKKQFISSKRSKLYGQTELLANFGGLLGFFLGISLLSFVEIIYFFTLRTYLLIKRKILPRGSSSTEEKSRVKLNVIRPATLNAIGLKTPIAGKRNVLFTQRRHACRNDIISQGF